MRLFYKKNGAVSVFLAIILVPMIVLCCLFVDASRSKLVQSLVSSSGDLALNTVLSQYDVNLEDYYGLMASCQTISDFYEVAEQYYYESLVSQGVDVDEASLYASLMKDITQGDMDDINDLLQIKDAGDSKFNIEAMSEDANLANAQMLKKATVEFMKYRGPIEGASDIYERFSKNMKAMEDSKKDAEIIEKQSEYAESEADVLKAAKKAYTAIKKYEEVKITKDRVDEIEKTLDELEGTYKNLHIHMVKDLYNTQSLNKYVADPDNLNIDYNTAGDSVDGDTTEHYLNETAKAINSFIDCAKSLDNAYRVIPQYNESEDYDIQYWVICDEVLSQNNSFKDYMAAAKNLNKQYKLLAKKMQSSNKEETSTIQKYKNCKVSGTGKNKELFEKLEEQYDSLYESYFEDQNSAYNSLVRTVGKTSQSEDANNRINSSSANTEISAIYQTLNSFYADVEKADEALKDACKYLDKMMKNITEMRQNYNEWETAVNKAGTALAEQQKADKANGSLEAEKKVVESFETYDITELKTRLQNISVLLSSIKVSIDGYQYNSYNGATPKKIKDIKNYGAFKKASNIESGKDKIVVNKKELEKFADESFVLSKGKIEVKITNDNNPALSVNSPETYTTLKKMFEEEDGNEKSDEGGKQELKNQEQKAKEQIKDDDNGNINSKNDIASSKKDRISIQSGKQKERVAGDEEGRIAKKTGLSNISNITGKLFENFTSSMMDTIAGMRDSIYSTQYIMNMFSYDTFESEARYKYENNYGVGKKTGDFAADFASTNPEILFNKTLTNKVISQKNNYAYGNEVEYILYGGSNSENKASAYASIFAIRFALNLYPEYSQNWKEDMKAASGFAAVSVPPVLIAVAMLIAQTATATVDDMKILKAGKPVNIIHEPKEIRKVSGNVIDGGKVELSKAFFYSDYLSLFLLIKISVPKTQNDIYLRMGDVIQANMQQNYDSGFLLKNSVTYFRANGTMKVDAMMLDLPLVTGYFKKDKNGLGTIKYEAIRGY